MSLSESRLHSLIDQTQAAIEDIFDDSDLDIDLENAGGVLTVRFENGTQIIVSRQPALGQLWLAARSGGFHFDYDEAVAGWRCDSGGELLSVLLQRATQEQGGESLDFSALEGE